MVGSIWASNLQIQLYLFAVLAILGACDDGECLMQLHGKHKILCEDASAEETNPPKWPSSVHVFDTTMDPSEINATLWEIFRRMGPLKSGKFSSERHTFLFKPGSYSLDVPVGYYTQVLGLGTWPSDVRFTGYHGVFGPSEEDNNNFNTFWKAAENLANQPTSGRSIWSVSQAAPLRRVKVIGDLLLGSYKSTVPSKGSGGFIADVQVEGSLDLVRQQQWLIRNCKVNGTRYFQSTPRAVNFVYLGTTGSPRTSGNCTDSGRNPGSPKPQVIQEPTTPVQVEKPYISISADGKYDLHIPQPIFDGHGISWDTTAQRHQRNQRVSFGQVFVASNATKLALINAKLAAGKHVILTPGIYHLSAPIRIGWNETVQQQVLLGLGMATLIPIAGTAAVEIGPALGVRVAGVLLQAGQKHSKNLLWWSNGGDPKNPGLLSDVFARVGGPDTSMVSAEVMIAVSGSHVVMDNVWAWRADCCQNGCGTCAVRYCDHGVVVDGDHVTSYGLFSEHCQKDLLVWNGEHGQSIFFQSEMDSFAREPWDHTPNYGENGVSGYRVNAQHHRGVGIGVYAYFTQPGNVVAAGVVVANASSIKDLECPFYWNLNPAWFDTGESGIRSDVRVAAPVMTLDA